MAFVSLKTYADDKSVPLYYDNPLETKQHMPKSGSALARVHQNGHTLYIQTHYCGVAYISIVASDTNQMVGETSVINATEWQLSESLKGQFIVYININGRKMHGYIEL